MTTEQEGGGTPAVMSVNDGARGGVFLLDVIRSMMNERRRRAGSVFEVQMPEPDSPQGPAGTCGGPFFSTLKTERDTHLSLTSDVKDREEEVGGRNPREGIYDFDEKPPNSCCCSLLAACCSLLAGCGRHHVSMVQTAARLLVVSPKLIKPLIDSPLSDDSSTLALRRATIDALNQCKWSTSSPAVCTTAKKTQPE